jgi:hypothetical protein
MKHEIPLRIVVTDPLPGVAMRVQRGRDELLDPTVRPDGSLIFDFDISVDDTGDLPNFLGKYAQGPKTARFVYVNSGTYAADGHSVWGRRAKISLMGISNEQVEQAVKGRARVQTSFPGVGRDGGPTCASVKGIVWTVEKVK